MREAKSHCAFFLAVIILSLLFIMIAIWVIMHLSTNAALSSGSSEALPDRELFSTASDPIKHQEENSDEPGAYSSQKPEGASGGSVHIWRVHGVILNIDPTENSATVEINQADDSQLTDSQITYLFDERTDVGEYSVGQNVVVEYVPPNDANGGKRAEQMKAEG